MEALLRNQIDRPKRHKKLPVSQTDDFPKNARLQQILPDMTGGPVPDMTGGLVPFREDWSEIQVFINIMQLLH